jgi:putative peptidoglycan lipid II flippase
LHLFLVAVLIAGGMAVYGLFLALLGVLRWADAIHALRQSGA